MKIRQIKIRFSLKWTLLSMAMIVLFQLLMLILSYITVYQLYGVERYLRSILVIAMFEIPLSVLLGSFLCAYFFRESQVADIVAGMGLYVVILNLINLIYNGTLGGSAFMAVVILMVIALMGAWPAKKLRNYTDNKKIKPE